MVDLRDPDFTHIRVSAKRWRRAQIAELEPGDAIFVPSMWWHHVEGLEPSTCWSITGGAKLRFLAQPQDTLNHAMLAVRDLPESEKALAPDVRILRVRGRRGGGRAHLAEQARGMLDPLDAESAGRIRANLLQELSR